MGSTWTEHQLSGPRGRSSCLFRKSCRLRKALVQKHHNSWSLLGRTDILRQRSSSLPESFLQCEKKHQTPSNNMSISIVCARRCLYYLSFDGLDCIQELLAGGGNTGTILHKDKSYLLYWQKSKVSNVIQIQNIWVGKAIKWSAVNIYLSSYRTRMPYFSTS